MENKTKRSRVTGFTESGGPGAVCSHREMVSSGLRAIGFVLKIENSRRRRRTGEKKVTNTGLESMN